MFLATVPAVQMFTSMLNRISHWGLHLSTRGLPGVCHGDKTVVFAMPEPKSTKRIGKYDLIENGESRPVNW
jgi:hypothetical protein